MPSTATRVLDLVFRINTSQFDRSYNNVIQKINNIKVALNSLNSASGSGSLGLNQTVRGFNNATRAAKHYGSSLVQTKNSMRIFGNESGILKFIAIIRSEFLLAAFAIGRFVTALKSTVEEARDTQMALAGVQSIAKGMGHDVDKVNSIVKKYADTGLLTMRESANAVKMLSSMEGVTIDLVDKAMQAMLDFAAFNRLGQYTIGEAVMVAAQGFKEQRAQVTDAIGWVKNLQDAWKEYGKEIGVSMGKQSPAQKNLGSLNILIKDSTVVQGNAQRALELYGGSVSKLNTALSVLKREIGETLIPIMADWARKFYVLVDSALKYYKVNRDIIALNMKEGFSSVVDALINTIKFLGQATAKLVEFVAKNKDLVILVSTLVFLNKLLPVSIVLFGKLSGVLKTLSVWVGIFKAASNFKEVMILLNTAVTVFLGPFGWLLIALGAGAAAYLLITKNAGDYYKELKKQRAEDTQKLRAYNEQIEATSKLKTAERDLIRAKILAGDSSIELKNKEDQLTTSLTILEGQAKRTGDAIRKSLLLQNIPTVLDIGERAQKTSKVSLYTDPVAAFFSRITGINAVEAAPRMKKLVDSLNPYGILVEQISKTSDEGKLRQYQVKVLEDLKNISGFPVGKTLTGQERKDIDELTRAYSELLPIISDKLPQAVIKTTKTTEEQSDAMKRWLEALRNLQQETVKAPLMGIDKVIQDSKNKIEDIAKLAPTLKEITPEVKKLFKDYMDAKQVEYMNAQVKKLYDTLDKRREKAKKDQIESEQDAIKNSIALNIEFRNKMEELRVKDKESSMRDIDLTKQRIFTEGELAKSMIPANTALKERLRLEKEIDEITKNQVKIAERTEFISQMQQWQQVFSPLSQMAEDVFVNIRQEERDTIDSLRKELEKGTIDQQEYLARVDLAHRNAAISIQNAWNNAGRNILTSMVNYLSQLVTETYIKTGSMTAALGAINPEALALGLGIAAIGAGVSALAANTFKEKATLNYEDINPNSVSDAKRRTYGSISAASPMYVTITPTVSFENQGGGQIFIGSGSVSEFSYETSEIIKNTIQSAIDSNTIDLSGIGPR
jgi:hypothetical protein